jgi:hypothetical protein
MSTPPAVNRPKTSVGSSYAASGLESTNARHTKSAQRRLTPAREHAGAEGGDRATSDRGVWRKREAVN